MLKIVWANNALRVQEGVLRTLLTDAGWQENADWSFTPGETTVIDPDLLINQISRGTNIHPVVVTDQGHVTVELR